MPAQKTPADLLRDPQASAAALVTALCDVWGGDPVEDDPGFLAWDPETVRREAEDLLKAPPPDGNLDKIQAMALCLTSDRFASDPQAFLHVVESIAQHGTDFRNFSPVTVSDICAAMAEILLIDPDTAARPFSDDVASLVRSLLTYEGFAKPPRMLEPMMPVGPEDEDEINGMLDADAVDTAAWWQGQAEKRRQVDTAVKEAVSRALQQTSELRLENAVPGAMEALRERAGGLGNSLHLSR